MQGGFMKTWIVLVLGAFVFSGCVSSGKHKAMVSELESQLASERAANEENQKNMQALEGKLLSTTKDRGQLQASLEEMRKAMEEMKARQAEQKKRLQEFADLTKRFKKLTDAGTLSVKIVDGKMVVSLGSDVMFPAGSSRLSKEGLSAVKEVATQLASIPGKKFQVEGHTDNMPISTPVFPSNWELASARSLSVVKMMIENGMPADRVSAASFADTYPVQSNDSAEGRAANRRVAIVVVPDLASLPGYEELQKYAQ
jgi:chemotaxis protein MotB